MNNRRRVLTYGTTFLAVSLLTSCSQPKSSHDGKVVSFIQFTDAHLFDEKLDPTSAEKTVDAPGPADQTRNAAAVRWAAGVIESTTPAVGFAVFTGDLGLECVYGSGNPTDRNCAVRYSMDQAVNTVDTLLGSVSGRVFFLPGNNDLLDENVGDLYRYQAFMDALTRKRPNMIDLSRNPEIGTRFEGYRVAGVNSAAFKYPDRNAPICKQRGDRESGCPQTEIANVQQILADECPDSRVVIFTHVPDLSDPHSMKSSWNIPTASHDLWTRLQRQPCVAGVFAGHFHSQDPSRYGVATSQGAYSPGHAHVWVAPPLADKYQNPEARMARGVLYVRLPPEGEPSVTTLWYDPASANAGNSARSE